MKLFKKLAAIALVAVMALAMVGCYSAPAGATLNDKQATALAALVSTDRKTAGKEIDGKKVDMNKSEMAVGFAKGVTATPDMIKNAMEHSKQKTGEGITEVNTWAPMVNADDGYLAIVWAEKSGATAVIAYNIVLK